MKNPAKKIKVSLVLLAAAFVLFGVCLMIWPQISAVLLCRLAGALILLRGLYKIGRYFSRGETGLLYRTDFTIGALTSLLGLLLLICTQGVLSALPIIIGIFVTWDSFGKLRLSADLKQAGLSHWGPTLVSALLALILGLAVLFNPFESAAVLTRLIGAAIVLDGIENLWVTLSVARAIQKDAPIEVDYIEIG